MAATFSTGARESGRSGCPGGAQLNKAVENMLSGESGFPFTFLGEDCFIGSLIDIRSGQTEVVNIAEQLSSGRWVTPIEDARLSSIMYQCRAILWKIGREPQAEMIFDKTGTPVGLLNGDVNSNWWSIIELDEEEVVTNITLGRFFAFWESGLEDEEDGDTIDEREEVFWALLRIECEGGEPARIYRMLGDDRIGAPVFPIEGSRGQ